MTSNHVYTGHLLHRTSRKIARLALLSVGLSALPLRAQDEPRDSLLARLRRAEQAIGVLQRQIAEQAESAVQSRSRAKLEFYGRAAVNGFGNSRRVNNVDNPQFVRPDTTPGVAVRGIGMAIRQTTLGLAITVPDVWGGAFAGDIDVDFYGGQMPSSGGRTFPLVRLRTARGFVRWRNADVMIGQESPLISALNPVTPAAIGTPDFAAAGNLWLWLPQVRAGLYGGDRVRIGAQAAVLAPTSGDPVAAFDTDYDQAERSQAPYLQARLSVAWDNHELAGEIGCGVHQGWLMVAATSARIQSQAVACDARVPATSWLELRGEAFSGRGIRGLGGGGIGQNITTDGRPLSTVGGWAQLNLRPAHAIQTGAGCGTDQPDSDALGLVRRRNDACALFTTLRPAGPLFVGAEVRRLRTAYASTSYRNDHVTISAGFEF
jgi:hypothetical protein